MAIKIGKMDLKKFLLLINDIIILILNIILGVLLLNISSKAKTYRGTYNLFIFQASLSIIIIVLDIILNIKNLISNYKGHNKYGMLIRFFMFYLIIPCVVLTYERSNNINHDDIKNISFILVYIGFLNDGFIIISMILSFMVIDIQKEEKILVRKNRKSINMSTVENMKLLEESNISSQIFTELEKKEE